MKAINGGQLTVAERAALTPPLLGNLVIGGHIVLTETERDRIPPLQLVQLAIGGYIVLTDKEIQQLPDSLRTRLEVGGYINANMGSVAASSVPSSPHSNSDGRPTATASLEPATESERTVQSALMLLVADRNNVLISREHLQTICRAAPDYALRFIDQHRTTLLQATGRCRAEIAHLIRSIEWTLRGASQFIEYHHDTEDTQFVHERLTNNPDDFAREDLHALLGHFRRAGHPIRNAALNVLSNYVASFAKRIAAEPPGMSQDIESLKVAIQNYGFNPDLNAILQKIDDQLHESADAFDQVATMRHIRSFFEELHENIGNELQRRRPNVGNGTPLSKCGQAIDYLERKHVITDKFKDLARCLYAILSDDDFGVHALKASRDFTRLCRNMVVEYAVTLFFELERRLAEPGDN
jgi:hypothetical protein